MVTSLKQLVPRLVTHFGLHQPRDTERISGAWNNAVQKAAGEEYASLTNVRSISRGTLEITVPHNAFVQELSFCKDELLAAMQADVPDEKIKRIKFVTG
jgi:predicted nucleic acid-binding Zn ribbon protein